MTITATLGSADEAFDRIDRVLAEVLEAALARAAEVIAYAARASHPYTDRTYNLTRSIEPQPVVMVNDEQAAGGVIAGEEYASYLEERDAFVFLAPAASRSEPMLDQALARLLREALARGAA